MRITLTVDILHVEEGARIEDIREKVRFALVTSRKLPKTWVIYLDGNLPSDTCDESRDDAAMCADLDREAQDQRMCAMGLHARSEIELVPGEDYQQCAYGEHMLMSDGFCRTAGCLGYGSDGTPGK